VACNTSSGQHFVVEASDSTYSAELFRPQNTNSTLAIWAGLCSNILNQFSPFEDGPSVTPPSGSASFPYMESGDNNIAAGEWYLETALNTITYGILFQPDGTVATVTIMADTGTNGPIDNPPPAPVLDSIGFIFPLLHWLYLADFGQTSPTTYGSSLTLGLDGGEPQTSNFYPAVQLPPTYNFLVNETMYQDMTAFINPNFVCPAFIESNGLPLKPNETNFFISYSCNERQLKSPVSLIITVIAANYPLVIGGWSIVKWIALYLEKRRKNGNLMFSDEG
jgi:hypothetical protein